MDTSGIFQRTKTEVGTMSGTQDGRMLALFEVSAAERDLCVGTASANMVNQCLEESMAFSRFAEDVFNRLSIIGVDREPVLFQS